MHRVLSIDLYNFLFAVAIEDVAPTVFSDSVDSPANLDEEPTILPDELTDDNADTNVDKGNTATKKEQDRD